MVESLEVEDIMALGSRLTPLEPEVIMLNGEAPGNGKAQTPKIGEVKSREPSRMLCNNSISVNDALPINPSLQLAMQYIEKYDNVNECDLSLRGRPVSEMESEEDCNLERSALEQKDEINPFSDQNKTSAPQAGNDVAGGISFEFQKNGACMRRNCKHIHFNRTAAYPNVGSIIVESSKTSPRPRPMPRTEIRRTELKIKFTIVTVIKVTVGLVQNADFRIRYLCPHIQKITPVMIQM